MPLPRVALIIGTINVYKAPAGWRHIHIDLSDRGIWDADLHRNVPVDMVADMRKLPFPDASVDRIQSWHALEHVDPVDAATTVAEFARVLKPGGQLDIRVPDILGAARLLAEHSLEERGLSVPVNVDGIGIVTFRPHAQGEKLQLALGWIYGQREPNMPDDHLNRHLWGYTTTSLTDLIYPYFETLDLADGDDIHLLGTRRS